MTPPELIALARRAARDPAACAVLGDAILESGWHHPLVMPLVLGMDVAPVRPNHRNRVQHLAWKDQQRRAVASAQTMTDAFVGKNAHWARAVLAALLFGAWDGPKQATRRRRGFTTRSPWPLIRAHVPRAMGEA